MLLAAMVSALWAVIELPEPLADSLIETGLRREVVQWKRRVISRLSEGDTTFVSSQLTPEDNVSLSELTNSSEIYRFRMTNSSGEFIWSSRSEEIGEQETRPLFDAIVAKGNIHYTQQKIPAHEIDGLRVGDHYVAPNENRKVVQIYTPLMHNGRFVGAIEFFGDVTGLQKIITQSLQKSLAILSAVALALMSLGVLVIYKTNRRSMSMMLQRNNSEREILDDQLRLSREVRLLGELNEWLQSSRSLGELFDMVARFLTHILPDAEGSVYVFSNSRDVLDGCASWNGGNHRDHIHPQECWGLRRGRTYEYGNSEIDFVCEHAEPHDGRSYFCFPILAHGETVGLMHMRALEGHDEGFRTHKKLARMCAEQISMAIANVRMRDQLHDQSVRDPLTGLFNRRHMTDCLRKCINAGQSHGNALSLIAVDVDHFKKFNDNHGHDAGDMVLRAVGSVLDQACDGDEVACRMGGEEFTLILPDLPADKVEAKAEQLRLAIEAISIRYGEKTLPHITISLGVAHYPKHGTMPQDLMRAADDALYEAKAKGRNQACVAHHGGSDQGALVAAPHLDGNIAAE